MFFKDLDKNLNTLREDQFGLQDKVQRTNDKLKKLAETQAKDKTLRDEIVKDIRESQNQEKRQFIYQIEEIVKKYHNEN